MRCGWLAWAVLGLVVAAAPTPTTAAARPRGAGKLVDLTAPIDRFVFVKVHKTGSSTVANVLERRAWKYNLTVALPPDLTAFASLNATSDVHGYAELVRRNGPVQAVLHHLVFDPPTARFLRTTLVPANRRARYFTILRRPWETFVSHFCFFSWGRALNRVLPAGLPAFSETDCVAGLAAYLAGLDGPFANVSVPRMWNPQATDLGVDPAGKTAPAGTAAAAAAAAALTARLDAELDLVLLTEHFDESMVLLKRLLRWELLDVVYLSLKRATAATPAEATVQPRSTADEVAAVVAPAARTRVLERFLAVDAALYAHYNATFWRVVAAQGPSFAVELADFRFLQQRFVAQCAAEEKAAAAAAGGGGGGGGGNRTGGHSTCALAAMSSPRLSHALEAKYGLLGARRGQNRARAAAAAAAASAAAEVP